MVRSVSVQTLTVMKKLQSTAERSLCSDLGEYGFSARWVRPMYPPIAHPDIHTLYLTQLHQDTGTPGHRTYEKYTGTPGHREAIF